MQPLQHQQKLQMAARQRGETPAELGPGLGFKNLKWIKPVYVGDRLSYGSKIKAKSISEHRPRWGVVTCDNWAVNQNGITVFEFSATVMRERRP
jgi:acyl dehydratase